MTNARPYRPARSLADALTELRRCSGTQFDAGVVEALADVVEEGPTGWVTTVAEPAAYSSRTSAPVGSKGTRST